MPNYSAQLDNITKQMTQLKGKQEKLLKMRYQRIGLLAERCGVITESDEVIAGLFLSLSEGRKNNSPQLQGWQKSGSNFLKPKSKAKPKPVETADV